MLYCFNFWFFLKHLIVLVFLSCDIKIFSFTIFKVNSSIFHFAHSIKISKSLPNGSSFGIRKGFLFYILDSVNRYNSNTFYPNESLNIKSLKFYRNRYSFVPYNNFSFNNCNKFSNYNKIHITPFNHNKPKIEFYPYSRYDSSLYLFKTLRNWIEYKFSAWYVPPMIIGQKVSSKLKELGPIQTDEESRKFLQSMGATENDSIFDVVEKLRAITKNDTSGTENFLRNSFQQYMRKFFIYEAEKLEDVASKGFKAWKEYWKPTKEELEEDPNTFSKEDELFLSWWPNSKYLEESLKEFKKKRSKLNLIETSRFKGLIRFSKDFKGRFYKCSKTMFPLMGLGLIPELGPISIGISTILASKIIYQGDPKEPDNNRDYTAYLTSRGYDRSEAIKSIATMFIITLHSILGYFMSCMAIAHTKLGSFIPSEMINSFFINSQLTLCALIYDTSEMSYDEKVKLSQYGFKNIPDDKKPTTNVNKN